MRLLFKTILLFCKYCMKSFFLDLDQKNFFTRLHIKAFLLTRVNEKICEKSFSSDPDRLREVISLFAKRLWENVRVRKKRNYKRMRIENACA